MSHFQWSPSIHAFLLITWLSTIESVRDCVHAKNGNEFRAFELGFCVFRVLGFGIWGNLGFRWFRWGDNEGWSRGLLGKRVGFIRIMGRGV